MYIIKIHKLHNSMQLRIIFKGQLFKVTFKLCAVKIFCGIQMEKKPHKVYTQGISVRKTAFHFNVKSSA